MQRPERSLLAFRRIRMSGFQCLSESHQTATLNLIPSFGAWTRSWRVPRYRSVV